MFRRIFFLAIVLCLSRYPGSLQALPIPSLEAISAVAEGSKDALLNMLSGAQWQRLYNSFKVGSGLQDLEIEEVKHEILAVAKNFTAEQYKQFEIKINELSKGTNDGFFHVCSDTLFYVGVGVLVTTTVLGYKAIKNNYLMAIANDDTPSRFVDWMSWGLGIQGSHKRRVIESEIFFKKLLKNKIDSCKCPEEVELNLIHTMVGQDGGVHLAGKEEAAGCARNVPDT